MGGVRRASEDYGYVRSILSRPSFAQYVEREAAYLAKAPA
jgi:hypothetical protein